MKLTLCLKVIINVMLDTEYPSLEVRTKHDMIGCPVSDCRVMAI